MVAWSNWRYLHLTLHHNRVDPNVSTLLCSSPLIVGHMRTFVIWRGPSLPNPSCSKSSTWLPVSQIASWKWWMLVDTMQETTFLLKWIWVSTHPIVCGWHGSVGWENSTDRCSWFGGGAAIFHWILIWRWKSICSLWLQGGASKRAYPRTVKPTPLDRKVATDEFKWICLLLNM